MRNRFLLPPCALALALPAAAMADTIPTVVFSNIATSFTSDVPGMPGAKFNPGTTSLAAFDRPYVSPDGNTWILGAIIDGTTDLDALVIGSGLTGAGATTPVVEGQAIPGDSSLFYSALKTQVGINNAGQFAFAADSTAATTADDMVIRWNGSAFGIVAREGTQAPGQASGTGYGATNDAVNILAGGDVRFRSAALTGNTTQQVFYSNSSIASGTILAQTDITVPTGQLVDPGRTLDVLSRLVSDSSGGNVLYQGDLNGDTANDLVTVHNGTVVAQEGAPLPGWSNTSPVSTFSVDFGSPQVSAENGHFMFRGGVSDGTDFVVKNGDVIASTDQPIFAGATERFDDTAFAATFFLGVMNNNGDFVIGGTTDIGDVNSDAVLVFNNSLVIAREGDPVDLDGNGLFDDNTFIDVFGNDDGILTDDLRFYFVATLQDANNVSIGQAMMALQIPEPATALVLAPLAGLTLLRRRR